MGVIPTVVSAVEGGGGWRWDGFVWGGVKCFLFVPG